MGHGRYGHQAMEPADVGFLIDAYHQLPDVQMTGWRTVRPTPDLITGYFPCRAVIDGGILKHEQSY